MTGSSTTICRWRTPIAWAKRVSASIYAQESSISPFSGFAYGLFATDAKTAFFSVSVVRIGRHWAVNGSMTISALT